MLSIVEELKILTERLEYIFIKEVIKALKTESVSIEEARSLAIDFRKIEPFRSIEDAEEKVTHYTEKYPRFIILKEYADGFRYEQEANKKIEKMRKHMQENNIDEALKVAKGGE